MVSSKPLYTTEYGAAYVGDSLELLEQLDSDSNDGDRSPRSKKLMSKQ